MNFIAKKRSALSGAFSLLALLTLLALSGCSYDQEDYCDDSCECTGCTDGEYADCIDKAGDDAKEADYRGCTDQYDAYYSCVGDEFRCVESKVDTSGCGHELTSLLNCLP